MIPSKWKMLAKMWIIICWAEILPSPVESDSKRKRTVPLGCQCVGNTTDIPGHSRSSRGSSCVGRHTRLATRKDETNFSGSIFFHGWREEVKAIFWTKDDENFDKLRTLSRTRRCNTHCWLRYAPLISNCCCCNHFSSLLVFLHPFLLTMFLSLSPFLSLSLSLTQHIPVLTKSHFDVLLASCTRPKNLYFVKLVHNFIFTTLLGGFFLPQRPKHLSGFTSKMITFFDWRCLLSQMLFCVCVCTRVDVSN